MIQERRNSGEFLNVRTAFASPALAALWSALPVVQQSGLKGPSQIPGFLASKFIPALLFSGSILFF
jgi:hypothetical protein